MLIESLAQKTRLAMVTVLATIGGCVVICGFTVWCCISLVNKERDQIYILDGDIPFLAQRAQLEVNFTMEAKAHIQLFHQYFFNLPPDNDYIKWTVGKAMYMADGTALKQKQALDLYYDLLLLKEPPMRILYLLARQFNGCYHIKTIGDKFVKQMSVSEALHMLKLDAEGMADVVLEDLDRIGNR